MLLIPGFVVRLVTGGPNMVVEEVTGGGHKVRCVWFDRDDRAWSWEFLVGLLVPVHPPIVSFVVVPGDKTLPPTGPGFLQ